MGLPCILFHICHILRRHVERTKLHFLPHRNELSLALPHGGSGGTKSMAFGGWDYWNRLENSGESTVWLIRIYPNSSRSMLGCPVPPKAPQKISTRICFLREVSTGMTLMQNGSSPTWHPSRRSAPVSPPCRDAGVLWDSPMSTTCRIEVAMEFPYHKVNSTRECWPLLWWS